MDPVTAILLNWKRPGNVRIIIPTLRRQSASPHIVLVDNGDYTPWTPEQAPDEVWKLPHNVGPFARFLAAYAYEGWIYFQDDDVVPVEPTFIEDLLSAAKERPNAITGAYGRHVNPEPPHYRHSDTTGKTNFVKTICMMMHRTTLGRVRFPTGNIGRCDDLWVGFETAQGESIHFSDIELQPRLALLQQMGVGQSQQPGHYIEREQFCADWLAGEYR